MSGLALLSALLFAAVGVLSAHASWKTLVLAGSGAFAAALLASLLLSGVMPERLALVAAGLSMIPPILLVYFPRLLTPAPLILIAINCGLWAGALLSAPGDRLGLLVAAPFVALSLPARWMIQRRWQIGLKVAASWMLAIALLAVSLNTVSMPSYQLDHMQ